MLRIGSIGSILRCFDLEGTKVFFDSFKISSFTALDLRYYI